MALEFMWPFVVVSMTTVPPKEWNSGDCGCKESSQGASSLLFNGFWFVSTCGLRSEENIITQASYKVRFVYMCAVSFKKA